MKSICSFYFGQTGIIFLVCRNKDLLLHQSWPAPSSPLPSTLRLQLPYHLSRPRTQKWSLTSLCLLVPLPIQLSGLYRYPDISLNYPVILPCPQNHLWKSDHVPDIKLVLESRGAPSPIAGHSICPESWYSDSLASPLIDLPLLPGLFNEWKRCE